MAAGQGTLDSEDPTESLIFRQNHRRQFSGKCPGQIYVYQENPVCNGEEGVGLEVRRPEGKLTQWLRPEVMGI